MLFVCVKNAGKSQLAAALARQHDGDAMRVLSAGTSPGQHLNAESAAVLEEVGASTDGESPSRSTHRPLPTQTSSSSSARKPTRHRQHARPTVDHRRALDSWHRRHLRAVNLTLLSRFTIPRRLACARWRAPPRSCARLWCDADRAKSSPCPAGRWPAAAPDRRRSRRRTPRPPTGHG